MFDTETKQWYECRYDEETDSYIWTYAAWIEREINLRDQEKASAMNDSGGAEGGGGGLN